MNKKFRSIFFIVLLSAMTGLCISKTISASDQELHSKGAIILRDGTEFAIYADDIFYLQKEIDALFNEIN